MRMKIAVIVLATFMAATGCKKQSAEKLTLLSQPGNQIGTAVTTAIADAAPGYFVRTNGKASLATIRQRLTSIGAVETGYISQLNVLSVSTSLTFADFSAKLKDLNLTMGVNLPIKSPDVRNVTQISSVSPQLAGGNNPPSIGDNEPYFPILWGMDAIDAPQAWNAGYIGEGAVVAVLDEGFYLDHPDISANFLKTQARNFVNLDDLGGPICGSYPECDPSDVSFKRTGFSHATHVSGTIAALDNGIGVIGVAPSAKILPVKVLSDYVGYGLTTWIAAGIVYAADQGVDVINMSLGGLDTKGYGKGANEVQQGIKLFNEAIQYANSKGVLVVCSAGNSAIDFDHNGSTISMPAGSPHALSISATSPYSFIENPLGDLDIPTSYTNYGSSTINFAAPGGDFDSPSPYWYYDMVLSTSGPSGYYFAAGTSMAAPHVSGVAALIIGKYGHGTLNPAQVKTKLAQSADDLGKPGKDPYFGAGRVNAGKAVQ